MKNSKKQRHQPPQTTLIAPKPAWAPDTTLLYMIAIGVGILNMSGGDPGILLTAGLLAAGLLYSDRIEQLFNLPRKMKLLIFGLIAVPGTFFFHQLESKAYGLFFGGYLAFLNSTLGTFVPGSNALWPIVVAFLQFSFVLYLVIDVIRRWRGRDNDEDYLEVLKSPIKAFISLSVLDFILGLVIA